MTIELEENSYRNEKNYLIVPSILSISTWLNIKVTCWFFAYITLSAINRSIA